jgi:PIN domain nuclease of toxin-antitoxin system
MTNFLLDTIAFDFLVNANGDIPKTTKSLIEDSQNNLFLSIVSIWEMSIQAAQQKITFAKPFQEVIYEELRKHEITLIELSVEDTHTQASMPFLNIHGKQHKDPFDRIIIAQAIHRTLPVVSCDSKFPFYPIEVIWD